MGRCFGKSLMVVIAIFVVIALAVPATYAAELKIGYVDIRRAFYEYDKSKNAEQEFNTMSENFQKERDAKIEELNKMRDEGELLSDAAKAQKQREIEEKVLALQEFDRTSRQELVNKRNEKFKEVVDDIQVVVEDLGKKEGYDYILDSRNIMYVKDGFDLTDKVLEKINKQ